MNTEHWRFSFAQPLCQIVAFYPSKTIGVTGEQYTAADTLIPEPLLASTVEGRSTWPTWPLAG